MVVQNTLLSKQDLWSESWEDAALNCNQVSYLGRGHELLFGMASQV